MTKRKETKAREGGDRQGARRESSPEDSPSPEQESAADYPSDPSPIPSDEAGSPDDSTQGAADSTQDESGDATELEQEGEEDPVAKLEAERAEYLNMAQRARAELENYRRRTAGDSATAERRGRVSVAREVLPALDNLERALLAAGVDTSPEGPPEDVKSEQVSAADAFAQGVALVFRELRAAIARAGITELDPTGERFDPNHHEAIAKRAADGAESGTVIETLQRGYLLGDHSIRPARVIVAE